MRLIDADALEKEIKEKDIMGGLNYRWYIQNAPTVDVLDKIMTEIERLHYHPKLDFIKNDEVVDMALDIIDKYREEQTDAT